MRRDGISFNYTRDFNVWVRKSLRKLCSYNVAKVTERERSIDRLVNHVHLHRGAHIVCARPWRTCGPILAATSRAVRGTVCGTLGPQGAAYYRCGINFNFARVHHLRCQPVAKAARLALRLPSKTNKPRSLQRYLAHVLPARSFNPSNVYGTHKHG